MGYFARLFRRRQHAAQASPDQAVLVHLDGTGLPDEIYEQCDVATIEDLLLDALTREGTGELDGNEFGPSEVILFMYGKDAEQLFATVEPVLRSYALCKGARVVVRRGPPGAEERVIVL
ncbi:MAG: hypothetical protein H6806_11975 [Planctomycetes bacterium]|nr:hypothetical protein [Planctomycetota bacterium]MCB9824462.1 hypothetical protein [Planctomycetota bacterium]MCB9830460.1 hypothetical protein [Planctomycetota bacterium]MCB9900459.1 hypothetical protein [Planctomycetota bacterium]